MLKSSRRARSDRRERGATLALTALLMGVLILSVAIAIDLGRQSGERRDVQAAADVIALDLSRLANGRTLGEIQTAVRADGTTNEYQHVRARSATANRVELAELQDQFGTWDPETETFTPVVDPALVPNASRVVIDRDVDYLFQPGGGRASRTATSYQPEVAHMAIGTKFAEANPCIFQGGTNPDPCDIDEEDKTGLNKLLELLSGVGGVDIDAVSYKGLVSANVTLEQLAAAAGFGSPEEFVAAEITPTEAARISATALTNDGDLVRAGYFANPDELHDQPDLEGLSEQREEEFFQPTPEDPDPPVQSGVVPADFYRFDSAGSGAAAGAMVNLFDFYMATLQASNLKNSLKTCAGTVKDAEIQAAHDGVDDPEGGENAAVEPTDYGTIAVIGDEVCVKLIASRTHGAGPLGSPPLLKEQLRTAQAEVTHSMLVRYGPPKTNVPLAPGGTIEPYSLLVDSVPDTGLDDPLNGSGTPVPTVGEPLAIPIEGDLTLPLTLALAGGAADVTAIRCDDASNAHEVDVNVFRSPTALRMGNGNGVSLGTLTVTDPVTKIEHKVVVKVKLEVAVQPQEAAFQQGRIPLGETFRSPGGTVFSAPTITVEVNNTSNTLPDAGGTFEPVSNEVTALTKETVAAVVADSLTTVVRDLLVKQRDVEPTTYALANDLVAVLDRAGLGVGTVDVTNVGIGTPVKDDSGEVVGLDVTCGLPTLVD